VDLATGNSQVSPSVICTFTPALPAPITATVGIAGAKMTMSRRTLIDAEL
jgi:hypothetical protein